MAYCSEIAALRRSRTVQGAPRGDPQHRAVPARSRSRVTLVTDKHVLYPLTVGTVRARRSTASLPNALRTALQEEP